MHRSFHAILAALMLSLPSIANAQSFAVDVDYQIQRQYKGPLLMHDVFTNQTTFTEYITGGSATRSYIGQIIVLALPNETPVPFVVGFDGTNFTARSIAPRSTDPNALFLINSELIPFWSDPGGSSTNETILATSPISTNGVADVTFDSAAYANLAVVVQMANTNLASWTTFEPFTTPGAIRIVLTNSIPAPSATNTTVSNITVYAWSEIERIGQEIDTTGQIIEVDTATQPRQAVPLAQMQAAVAANTPAGWADYPATQSVRLNDYRLLLGSGWSLSQTKDFGILSFGEVSSGTNNMVFSHNGVPVVSLSSGLVGLNIAAFSFTESTNELDLAEFTGMFSISTNGVADTPFLLWSASLDEQEWSPLTPISETYPSTNAAGHYGLVASLAGSYGFIMAVYNSSEASASFRSHATPSATNSYDLGSASRPWRTAYLDALIVAGVDIIEEFAASLNTLTNLTAGAGISITGSGRTRTITSTITQYGDTNAVAAIKADPEWVGEAPRNESRYERMNGEWVEVALQPTPALQYVLQAGTDAGSQSITNLADAVGAKDALNKQTATGLIADAVAPYYLASNPSNFTSAAAVNAITNNGFTINGVPVANGSKVTVAASGGSPSAIFIPWYENDFNDSDQPNKGQIGTPLIYCVWQDYSNSISPTRLNAKIGASVSNDVWTITHHAGPQTGTNVTFNVLYAITKGQATPSAWTFTNAVTATWNATNMYDNTIKHTLTNTVAGTNSVRLWISKGNSAIGSGYWYWGDTTIEVER